LYLKWSKTKITEQSDLNEEVVQVDCIVKFLKELFFTKIINKCRYEKSYQKNRILDYYIKKKIKEFVYLMGWNYNLEDKKVQLERKVQREIN